MKWNFTDLRGTILKTFWTFITFEIYNVSNLYFPVGSRAVIQRNLDSGNNTWAYITFKKHTVL